MFELSRKIFISALVLATLACAKEGPKSGGGVIDGGGGGDFVFSSKEEVVAAIQDIWKLFLDPTAANPLNVAYRRLEDKLNPTPEEFKIARILRKSMSVRGFFMPLLGTDAVHYLQLKKLQLPENSLCQGPHDHQFQAAVSKLNRDGEICMSVFGIMRLPSGAIRNDVLALFAHEIAHLNGYGEEDARLLQKFFLRESKHILRKGSEDVRSRFAGEIWSKVNSFWTVLVNYGVVDHLYLRRLQALQYESHKAQVLNFGDIIPGDDIEIARPDLARAITQRWNSWRSQIKEFGMEMGQVYDRDKKSRLTVNQWLTVRRLAMEMIEIQREVDLYFFGVLANGRPEALFDAEKKLIERATNPQIVLRPAVRPKLNCPQVPEARYSTWAKAHPIYNELFEARCSSAFQAPKAVKGPIALEAEKEIPPGSELDDLDDLDKN